jgi:hypothetical protein
MWWPILEEKISAILKSHVSEKKDKSRSEREILEEILDLSRMNSKKYLAKSGVSKDFLIQLVNTLDSLQDEIIGYLAPDQHRKIVTAFAMAVKKICITSEDSALYKKFINYSLHADFGIKHLNDIKYESQHNFDFPEDSDCSAPN